MQLVGQLSMAHNNFYKKISWSNVLILICVNKMMSMLDSDIYSYTNILNTKRKYSLLILPLKRLFF